MPDTESGSREPVDRVHQHVHEIISRIAGMAGHELVLVGSDDDHSDDDESAVAAPATEQVPDPE